MSSINPYADPKPKQKPQEDSEFKFIQDKDLNMSRQEMKGLVKAMETEEFKSIMSDYMKDISDPKNKEELEQYLTQCEENGELPPNTKLIRPVAGFCMKTSCSKLINRKEKKFFEQKTFINITSHEVMDPPKKVERVNNGRKGYTFELPYRVSKGRPDQDTKGDVCTTFDVVFHPEVLSMSMMYKGDFLKFVCDTALDGVGKVLAQDNEKISKDYKILRNLRCKGGKPASITIKVENSNPIINAMDPSKHETSLQKEIMSQSKDAKKVQDEEVKDKTIDEEDEDAEELQRIEGISTPKHKVVYSYPVNIQDCWEPPADVLQDRKFPVSLRVTIQTPFIDGIKDAELDINDDTLMFKVPDIYDLMLTFKYKVDPDRGNAKFEKDKKRLVIDLPITGVTEATHEIMKKEKEQFETNMKRITGGLVQDMEEYTESVSKTFETDMDLEQQVDMKKLKDEALAENSHEEGTNGFLKVYDETKTVKKDLVDDTPQVLNEIKYKEDDTTEASLLGVNPLNNNVELVKEIPADEPEENVEQIKKDLGIPEKPKEKEFEYIEAMFQQRNELVFFMFKIPNYKQDNVKYFVNSTHLYVEHDTEDKLTKSYLEFQKEIDPYETKVEYMVGFI
jgi:dynein assembly factor 2